MLKYIIIDDDNIVRRIVENILQDNPLIKTVGSFSNCKEAILYLENNTVDFILLDIEMPEITGFDLLNKLKSLPLVIIITSKKEYAYRAFEHHVADFVLKPIIPDRLKTAIEKILDLLKFKVAYSNDHFFVKTDSRLVKVNINEIYFIQGLSDYILIHTKNEKLVVLHTMKAIEKRLPSNTFVRVHKSFIVNLNHVSEIQDGALKVGDTSIQIGRTFKDIVYSKLSFLQ